MFCTLLLGEAKAQYVKNTEIGFGVGCAYYLGDLNPYFPFKSIRQAATLFARVNYNYRWATRCSFAYGMVTASDSKSPLKDQQARNLNFRSHIFEAAYMLEFNFLPYKVDDPKYPFSPYAFIGIGAFYFNPKGQLNGEWYALQPLATEGQGLPNTTSYTDYDKKKYSRIAMAIPFGMGIKWAISEKVTISLETSLRKTNTDYLDDVSKNYVNPQLLKLYSGSLSSSLADKSVQPRDGLSNVGRSRGNPNTKDWYSFSYLTLGFRLPTKGVKCPSYN